MLSKGPFVEGLLLKILSNSKTSDKDALKAIDMYMGRIGMTAVTEHRVTVQDDRRSLEELRKAFFELLSPRKAEGALIDVTPAKVEE